MSSLRTMASVSQQSLPRSASNGTTSTGTGPHRAPVEPTAASSISPAAWWTPPRTSGASRVGLALTLRIRFATYLQARRSLIPLPRSPSIFRLGLDDNSPDMRIGQQSTPSAYLDANLIIGIRKRDLGSEQSPLSRLLKAHKKGVLSLMTSCETRKEIEKRTPVHEGDEDIYALLADVPVVEGESLVLPVITNRGGSRLLGPVAVIKDDN